MTPGAKHRNRKEGRSDEVCVHADVARDTERYERKFGGDVEFWPRGVRSVDLKEATVQSPVV
jgi:hypothetical protein